MAKIANARPPKIPLPKKECKRPVCKTVFAPYRDWQEYCTPRCRALHYWETHEVVKTDEGEQVVKISTDVVPEQQTKTNN